MSAEKEFYEVWVWLSGKFREKVKVIVEAVPPLIPTNVKDFACKKGLFEWKNYTKIRYRRVTRREEKK